jgi:hypothetical protein
MRMYFWGTDAFGQLSDGSYDVADVAAIDVTWGTWASVASASLATQYQTLMLTGEAERLGANNGGVVLVDTGSTLAGLFVDVVRYGVL